jgi:glycosyltransferase involved in cell wall biosynthesis
MKVSFVTASVSREAGGLHEGVRRLAQSCKGWDLSVLGPEDKFTSADLPSWHPVRVRTARVFGPERFSYAPGLNSLLRQSDPEIVHLHGLWRYPSVAVSRWHRQTRRPYVVHPHGMLDPWAIKNAGWKKKIAGALFENKTLRQAACLRALCLSEAEAIRSFGCENLICIIPNGADIPTRSFSDAPWKRHLQPDVKILFYLGRLHPKKGLGNLIKAWAMVQNEESGIKKSEEWVLVLAGWDDGGHESELKELCRKLEVSFMDVRDSNSKPPTSNSIFFVGPQFGDAKSDSYHQADAFILPSYSEGLPMTILEAWAHEKPTVMTPDCNLPEGFEAGAAVRINTDPAEIFSGLERLFAMNSEARVKMGGQGLRLITEKFNWENVSSQLVEVSDWMLFGGTPPTTILQFKNKT